MDFVKEPDILLQSGKTSNLQHPKPKLRLSKIIRLKNVFFIMENRC